MTTYSMIPNPLSGVQKAAPENKNGIVMHPLHFFVMVPGNGQHMVRFWVEDGSGYGSLKDAIDAVGTKTKGTAKEIAKMVAKDYGMGLGSYYPELNVVAYSGASPFDRPFAEYTTQSGEKKFVCHPKANLMVHIMEGNDDV